MTAFAKRKRRFAAWCSLYLWPLLRHLIVPCLCVCALFAGMVIGYVYLGHRPMNDVWRVGTWRHMYDLIFSDT